MNGDGKGVAVWEMCHGAMTINMEDTLALTLYSAIQQYKWPLKAAVRFY
jgi:hypothetical protein